MKKRGSFGWPDPTRPKDLSFFHSTAAIALFHISLRFTNWKSGTNQPQAPTPRFLDLANVSARAVEDDLVILQTGKKKKNKRKKALSEPVPPNGIWETEIMSKGRQKTYSDEIFVWLIIIDHCWLAV